MREKEGVPTGEPNPEHILATERSREVFLEQVNRLSLGGVLERGGGVFYKAREYNLPDGRVLEVVGNAEAKAPDVVAAMPSLFTLAKVRIRKMINAETDQFERYALFMDKSIKHAVRTIPDPLLDLEAKRVLSSMLSVEEPPERNDVSVESDEERDVRKGMEEVTEAELNKLNELLAKL